MKRALVLSALLLAACGRSEDEEAAPNASPVPTPTVSAQASGLSLAPLQSGDGQVVADNMSNVGGCSFHDQTGTLLLSVGIPDTYGMSTSDTPAIGVARINGRAIKLTLENALPRTVEEGPALSGEGFTVTVLRAEGEGKTLDREVVEYAADLVVSDGSGDSRTYSPGGWRCGV